MENHKIALYFKRNILKNNYFINQLSWRCYIMTETLENINENDFEFVKRIFLYLILV